MDVPMMVFRRFLATRLAILIILIFLAFPALFGEGVGVGITTGFPPYQYMNERGQLAGLDLELAQAVFRQLGQSPRFVVDSWDNIVSMLRRSIDLTMATGMEISEERSRIFDFSRPIYRRQGVIVALATKTDILTIRDLGGRIVAGDLGTWIQGQVEKYKDEFRIRLIVTKSKEEAMGMLKSGKVDACLMPEAVALYLSRAMDVSIRRVPVGDPGSPVALAFSKGNGELLSKVNASLIVLTATGEIDAILAKWLK